MDKHKGFTIVELIIAIVVIAILAAITTVSYMNSRDHAMDTKIRATVKDVGDALALYESEHDGSLPVEGYLSTAGGTDTLVSEFLKTNYRDGLKSRNTVNSDHIIKWHRCTTSAGGFVVYASLTDPTSEDKSSFSKLRLDCGHDSSLVAGPEGASSVYNYAQQF